MKSFCSYFDQGICQSCTLIENDYLSQLKQKQSILENQLAKFSPIESLPPIASSQQGFRNKAKIVVSGTLDSPILGLLDKDLLNCPVHHPAINKLLPQLKSFIKQAKLVPYNIDTQKGELKYLILFTSQDADQIYLRFVLRSQEAITRIQKFLPELTGIQVISANIQSIPHAILEGPQEIFLTESKNICLKFDEVSYRIHPQGFVQTNQQVAEKLYRTAAQWVKETGKKNFIELFSGQGAFSFFCAPTVEQAMGIEINPQAVEQANLSAQENKQTNLKFFTSDAALVIDKVNNNKPDIMLVNPPRRGIDQATEIFKKYSPDYLIYSSCNSETLCKDLEELQDIYQVEKYQLFDMFPHTHHFETLVLLKKRLS